MSCHSTDSNESEIVRMTSNIAKSHPVKVLTKRKVINSKLTENSSDVSNIIFLKLTKHIYASFIKIQNSVT